MKAHGLHGTGLIGHVGAHLVNRLHQRADAEHLGRLRQPLVAAVHGGGHAHAARAVDGSLERVGQLVRQQPAHTVARALVDERIDLLRGHQAARSVMHQDPVARLRTTLQQRLEAAQHRVGTRGAPTLDHKKCGVGMGIQKAIPRCHSHQRAQQAPDTGKGGQCVQHHRVACHQVILLGQRARHCRSTGRQRGGRRERRHGRCLHGLCWRGAACTCRHSPRPNPGTGHQRPKTPLGRQGGERRVQQGSSHGALILKSPVAPDPTRACFAPLGMRRAH